MQKSKTFAFVVSAATALAVSALAQAAAFTVGNLVVSQFGADDATSAVTSAATQTFFKEFTLAGTQVQSFSTDLRNSGTSTSEGFLSYSNGFLAYAGYTAPVGTTPITSSTSAIRAIEVYNLAGTGTVTNLNETASLGNPRSASTSDGINLYAATSTGGVRYTTAGATTESVQLSTTPNNTRVVKVVNGQLYVSSASGVFLGVNTIGTGTPTTGALRATVVPGFPTTGGTTAGGSSYDYYFADANTVYVADDNTTAATPTGGIQKWTFNGTTWSKAYTLATGATTATNLARGLAGVTVAGVTTLYATTNGTSLVSVVDLGATSVFSVLATAPANTVFRGVAFLTPSAVAAIAGDYNHDGFVDAADYTVWADHFGQTGTGVAGDGNNDGVVNAADYTVWADHFGQGVPHVSAVPEPTALAFAAPAMALLARRRR